MDTTQCARKGVNFSGETLLPADKEVAQRLTWRAKAQRGTQHDAKRGNEGSIKPECSPGQSRYGEG